VTIRLQESSLNAYKIPKISDKKIVTRQNLNCFFDFVKRKAQNSEQLYVTYVVSHHLGCSLGKEKIDAKLEKLGPEGITALFNLFVENKDNQLSTRLRDLIMVNSKVCDDQ
jgi:hypothetical protein